MISPISPCIHVCKLDKEDVCVGCGRTMREISEWFKMTEEQREEVFERLRKNKK